MASGDGILTGITQFAYRKLGSSEWLPLGSYDSRDGSGLYPLAIEADSNSVFVLKKLDGRDALYRMSLDGAATTTLVAKNPSVDIDGVTRFGRGQRVIGYTYADDRRHTVYFDPEFKKLADSLGRALPNLPILDFADASADGTKLLVFAGSDTAPGHLLLARPEDQRDEPAGALSGRRSTRSRCSPVKSVRYAARDGTIDPGLS